ncbi:MAG: NlpC/P60 family protein [Capnocytophaga sp.]|nr:NlpC/P60 family protein [Capnocytophaga sp.]
MNKIWLVLGILLLLFTSCAERYSTRKRTSETEEIVTSRSQKVTIDRNKRAASASQAEEKNAAPAKSVTVTPSGTSTKPTTKSSPASDAKQKLVIDTALSYLGTPYRYGGTTRKGMDCSGLVGVSFKTADVSLHRSSHEMANQGTDVSIKNVQIGDLLFFVTGKNSRISHVGIVVETAQDVKFIHSSTSRGVIISSLNEGYWKNAYRKAKRVLM